MKVISFLPIGLMFFISSGAGAFDELKAEKPGENCATLAVFQEKYHRDDVMVLSCKVTYENHFRYKYVLPDGNWILIRRNTANPDLSQQDQYCIDSQGSREEDSRVECGGI